MQAADSFYALMLLGTSAVQALVGGFGAAHARSPWSLLFVGAAAFWGLLGLGFLSSAEQQAGAGLLPLVIAIVCVVIWLKRRAAGKPSAEAASASSLARSAGLKPSELSGSIYECGNCLRTIDPARPEWDKLQTTKCCPRCGYRLL